MVEHTVQQFISSHRSKPGQEDKSGYTGSRSETIGRSGDGEKKRRQTFHKQMNHFGLFFPHRRRFYLCGRAENIPKMWSFSSINLENNTFPIQIMMQLYIKAILYFWIFALIYYKQYWTLPVDVKTSCRSSGLIVLSHQTESTGAASKPGPNPSVILFYLQNRTETTVVAMVTAVYDVTHVWCSVYLVNDQQIIFHPSWTCQLPAGAAERVRCPPSLYPPLRCFLLLQQQQSYLPLTC